MIDLRVLVVDGKGFGERAAVTAAPHHACIAVYISVPTAILKASLGISPPCDRLCPHNRWGFPGLGCRRSGADTVHGVSIRPKVAQG